MEQVTIGSQRGFLALPESFGPAPGVIVLHEIFGLNDDIKANTRRLADAGYVSLALDLYSAGNKALCIARAITDMARGNGPTVDRIEAARSWLVARPEVAGSRIGVIGFCMGGAFALAAAIHHDFAAASVNYGRVPKGAGALDGICPVVGAYGRKDLSLRRDPARLEAALTELGVAHDVKVYPNAGHSFLNKGAPSWLPPIPMMSAGYVPEAADDAWARILPFFDEHLRN
ncbi:MAG: dienelactone hydrolase family protein [Actinobacteria bacterium]|nr:dienelactone hydrolase family protein [Actinomycetota bacterium]